MPEVYVRLRWPDGAVHDVYSPSLVVTEVLEVGRSYPVGELVPTLTRALQVGSDRVLASYGFPCSRAAAALVDVGAKGSASKPTGLVAVEAFLR